MKPKARSQPVKSKPQSQPAGLSGIVLIAVTGESPAILTETVWALAREKPRAIPQRVIAITTTRGRERLKAELLDSGVWERLRRELRAKDDELLFGASDSIRVISSRAHPQRDLDDIVTAADNLAAADAILETVRGLTSNPDVRLIASLAGGRKTMSAFMALALTLVGRPEDRLCHVLVNAPFDAAGLLPKFYFPTHPPTQHELRDRSGCGQNHLGKGGKAVEIISSVQARIELADVPFVPLAKLFEKDLKQPAGGYAGLVTRLRGRIEEGELPTVKVDATHKTVQVGESAVSLNAQEFAMFYFAATRCKAGKPFIRSWPDFAEALLIELQKNALLRRDTGSWMVDEPDRGLRHSDEWEHLRKLASSIRKKLEKVLPNQTWANRLALTRERGQVEIDWPAEKIRIV